MLRLTSLRGRVLVVGLIFSTLIVGTVFTTTYFVVTDGMSGIAASSSDRVAQQAKAVLSEYVRDEILRAQGSGPLTPEVLSLARRNVIEGMGAALVSVGASETGFVLADIDLRVLWSTDAAAYDAALAAPVERKQALAQGIETQSRTHPQLGLSGLFGPTDLGLFTTNIPIELPGGDPALLSVVYNPRSEASLMNKIRLPMALLALTAMLFAVAMVEVSMTWILRLVDDLRRAADAIDADQLDIHLPEYGAHEIGDLGRSLNALIFRLRKRADAQTRFLADASHELATPVAGIRGYIGILRAWGADDPEVRDEAIDAVDRESKRMVRLCGELLAVIRSENISDIQSVKCDINALCREALASTATRYLEKGLDFAGPEEAQLVIFSDPDRIDQMLSILLDNAAKYTPPGGQVRVATYPRRDGVLIEVSDTGIGIPEKDLSSIFDRFYRSDDSRCQATGGFGLGLAIAYRLAEALGGSIAVRSIQGEGTTFALSLPRTHGLPTT